MAGEKIEGAPGLEWRKRRNGVPAAYWIAPRAAVKAGFEPRTVRLFGEDIELASACVRLQAEALQWMADRAIGAPPVFDGSIASLIRLYETDSISPFRKVKWTTRHTYSQLLAALRNTVGERQLRSLTSRDFARWYEQWRAPTEDNGREHIAKASHMMAMLRMLTAYGVMTEVPECLRLRAVLSAMRFEGIRPRQGYLTAAMVEAFRSTAHASGRPSMALATAIQFETAMRQRDVIGEWAPASGAPDGPLARHGTRWQGLTWGAHIDADMILRKPTSKSRGRKVVEVDLRRCPMIVDELAHVPLERRVGPVIVSEETGGPYHPITFSRLWRRIADRAGLPAGVANMDARAGALTEASEANVPIWGVQKLATHSDQRTTQRYMRGRATDEVIEARVRHRTKRPNLTLKGTD